MMVLYFVDNMIEIIYQKKVIRKVLNKSIDKGRILSKENFMIDFSNILKEEKIRGKLFGDKIKIVKESFYTYADIYFIEKIFEDLGFIKVEWILINSLFNKDGVYIEYNKQYVVIHNDPCIYLDLDIFCDFEKILSYLKIKTPLYFFGKSLEILSLCKIKEEFYCFESYENYVSDTLLNM